ncbi:hypothetical protein BH23GEM6_BH23GEM6_01690 [soil metagenome]
MYIAPASRQRSDVTTTLLDLARFTRGDRAMPTDALTSHWRRKQMRALTVLLLMLMTTTLTGCELIGDIFRAGVWVGVIAVLAILALIGFLFSRTRR